MSLWQASWRNLIRKKMRTFLTLLAIIIGVSSIFAVISTVETAKEVTDKRLELYTGNADYSILTTSQTFSEEVLRNVSEERSINSATGLIHKQGYIQFDTKEPEQAATKIRLTGLSSFENDLLSLKVIEGNIMADGLIIPRSTAELWKIKTGDSVTLNLPTGLQESYVSAIVADTPLLEGPTDWEEAETVNWRALVSLPTLQNWSGLNNQVQEIRINLSPSASRQSTISKLDNDITDPNIYFKEIVLDEKQSNQLEELYFMLYVIGGLAMFVSAFILYNTLFITITERKNEIAIMKTIGYTPSQIIKLFLTEVGLLSIIGLIFGIPLGFAIGALLQSGLFSSFQSDIDFEMEYRSALVLSVIIGTTIPLLASLIPVLQASKINIITTLKNVPEDKPTINKVRIFVGFLLLIIVFLFIDHDLSMLFAFASFVFLFPILMKGLTYLIKFNPLLGFEGKIASNNIWKTLNRSSNTSLVLALAISLGLFVSSIFSSIENNVSSDIARSFGGDIQFTSEVPLMEEQATAISEIAEVRDFYLYKEREVPWGSEKEKRQFSILGVDPNWNKNSPLFYSTTYSQEKLMKKFAETDGVVLGDFAFNEWGGNIGEFVSVVIDNETKKLKVLGSVSTNQYGGYVAFVNDTQFNKLFPETESYKGFVNVKQNEAVDEAKSDLLAKFPFELTEVKTLEEEIEKQQRALPGVSVLFNGLLLLVIAVTGIGMVNTLVMNVMERIREIGIMRATAFTSSQVNKTIIMEGLIIGLNGIVLGIGLGILMIYLNSSTTLDPTINFVIPLSTLVLSILVGLIVSILATLLPSYKASKIELQKALKQD